MTNPVPFERRLTRVEADAADALELARAHDRDIAELPLKVDANRQAINALGLRVAGLAESVDRRFEQVDRRFEQLELKVDEGFARADANFARVRFQLDQTAAGLARITDLLERREPGGN